MKDDAKLEEFIRANYTHAELKAIWDKLLTAQKVQSVPITCRCGCNKTFKYDVEFEDRKTISDMARWLGERGYGKAPAAKVEDEKPIDLSKPASAYTAADRRSKIAELERRLGA